MSERPCCRDQAGVQAPYGRPRRTCRRYGLLGAVLVAALVTYGVGVASAGASMALRGAFTEEVQQFQSLEGDPPRTVANVALSADGSTAAVAGTLSGEVAVRVFVRSGGKWVQQGPPVIPSGQETLSFNEYLNLGAALALSADGSTLLIGSPRDHSRAGAAWVFARSGEIWSQQGSKLTPAEATGLEEEFGRTVALSDDGSTALIGESRGLPPYIGVSGAWVFTRAGETWTQQGGRLGPATPEGDISVALSGDGSTALIGNPVENEAWVYARAGETWNKQAELAGRAEEFGEHSFGSAVALSRDGNTALVGADLDDFDHENPHPAHGAAYVFTRSGETWSQQGPRLTGTNEAAFGAAVALSGDGDIALIGGPTTPVKRERSAGAAAVSERANGVWSKPETLTGQGEHGNARGADSEFGWDVALSGSGNIALVGGAETAWAFADKPEIKTFSPPMGPASGGTSVTITGSHLEGATAVDFGSTPASFTVNGPTSITAITPEGSGSVSVSVTTDTGTATRSKKFKYE